MFITIKQLIPELQQKVESLVAALPTSINLEESHPKQVAHATESTSNLPIFSVRVGDKTWKLVPNHEHGSNECSSSLCGKALYITWVTEINPENGAVCITPLYYGVKIHGQGDLLEMMHALGYEHTRIAVTLGPLYRLGNPDAKKRVLKNLGINVDLTNIWIRREDRDHILAELLLMLKLQDGVPDGVQRLFAAEFWRDVQAHPNDT